MSVEYMREYLVVVEQMSFTAAAKRLSMTQSALSKHIAALEREFDATFFNRSAQAISLTQQGRAFCEEASRVIAAYDGARRRIHAIEPPIHIGGAVHDSAVMSLISSTRRALGSTSAISEINIVPTPYPALESALIGNAIDLFISVALDDDGTDDRIASAQFNPVPLIAVVEKGHRLAAKEKLALADFTDMGVMCPTGTIDSSRGSRAVERVFERAGIPIRKHIFFANDAMDFPYADLGDNVFVMPQSLYNKQLFGARMDELVAVPIDDPEAVFPYRVSWRAHEDRTKVRSFIETLMDEAALRGPRER